MLASIVRRSARILAGTVLAAAALAGCSDPTGSGRFVRLTTDRSEYVSGSSGTATLTNISEEPIYYNLCEGEVQRLTAGGWTTVAHTPGDAGFVCVEILLPLQPGESTSAGFVLRGDLPKGVYRLRYDGVFIGENAARASAQATPPFRVEPGFVLLAH